MKLKLPPIKIKSSPVNPEKKIDAGGDGGYTWVGKKGKGNE